MIFAVFDPSPLTLWMNCCFGIYLQYGSPSRHLETTPHYHLRPSRYDRHYTSVIRNDYDVIYAKHKSITAPN